MAAHRRASIAAAVALVLLILYPFAVGGLAAHLCEQPSLGEARPPGHGRATAAAVSGGSSSRTSPSPGRPAGPPLATIARLSIPFGAALGLHSTVEVAGLRVQAVRGGDEDNLDAILANLRGHGHHGAEAAKPEAAKSEAPKSRGRRARASPTSC